MFQRLKGAIDSRIAEEQARQRQAALSATSPKPVPGRRSQNQNGSTLRVSSRQREQNNVSTDKGPDPAEFEPEFAIGDDDSTIPSRRGTPKPDLKERDAVENGEATQISQNDKVPEEEGADRQPIDSGSISEAQSERPEMSLEVRVKLRKLEKLEAKYGELLKAYRIAHARIQTIEPFESSLREHTPLTSINDPGAFIEYINQAHLKSEMVLDELKRVATEREEIKKKYEHSEEIASQLRTELKELKDKLPMESAVHTQDLEKPMDNTAAEKNDIKEVAEPEAIAKSPVSTSSRIASFSLFSPRSKPTSPPINHASEDLFSYDSEVPRLENDLHESQREVESLKNQAKKLQDDLAVARESTEGMVQSLEEATRELHYLREAKDTFDATKVDLEKKIQDLENDSERGHESTREWQTRFEQLQLEKEKISETLSEIQKQLEEFHTINAQTKEQLEAKDREANILNQKLSQKDAVAKDLEDSLAMAKSAERQESLSREKQESSERKISTMQGIMDKLRVQLDDAEATIKKVKQETDAIREDFSSKPSTKVFGFLDQNSQNSTTSLESEEDIVNFLAQKFNLQKKESTSPTTKANLENSPSLGMPGNANKKKEQKEEKAKGIQSQGDDPEVHTLIKVPENLDEVEDGDNTSKSVTVLATSNVEHDLKSLREEVNQKSEVIERMTQKLKDQEALQEEIETLRDDLLHQGEEHVEARDELKKVREEKTVLEELIRKLESEVSEAKQAISDTANLEKALKELTDKFEDLTAKSKSLQTDLAAAEQLASARFKDIGDLKDLLSKAQPELRSLKNEVNELKSTKEELKNRTGDLNRLESRHEDLKAELKGLSKRLGDKDAEMKDLQQKLEQEVAGKTRMEEQLRNAQSEARSAEIRRQDAANSSNEISQELAKVKEERTTLKSRLRDLEDQILTHTKQVSELKDEVSLKTALHSSSQTLLQSLRDQTHELSTQAREASVRAENLEEELTEAQKMLSERTREGQTMRVLLNQAETSTDTRLREMKERMESAIEERDRTEDEANVSNRRMMRDVEEAKKKARDAQRELKNLQDEKEELEEGQRQWKRRKDELERAAERASKEAEEVRNAMSGLREALDENERQVHELETQKVDLRRASEEAKERLERLTKANKSLSEELKMVQSANKKGNLQVGLDSGIQSSRSSGDSSRVRSPAPNAKQREQTSDTNLKGNNPTDANQGTVDFVYLKNVLLQFMEQKDKGHRRQLIPVLGMLLHFDQKDEQRWASAIAAR